MFILSLIAALDPVNGDYLEQLVEEYSDQLYSIAYKMLGCKEDAEDMVQETFLKAYRSIEKIYNSEREEIGALLVIYVKNSVKDLWRRRKARAQTVPLEIEDDDGAPMEHDIPDFTANPEQILIARENIQRLVAAIDDLPEAQREVILLKYKFDMQDRDMARALGINVSAVSSRVNRARTVLRKKLEEVYDE